MSAFEGLERRYDPKLVGTPQLTAHNLEQAAQEMVERAIKAESIRVHANFFAWSILISRKRSF
jgi:hypothetical protein